MESVLTEREITQLQESVNRIEQKLEILPEISSEIKNIQENQVRIENEYSQLQLQTSEIQRDVDRNSFVIEIVSWAFIVIAGSMLVGGAIVSEYSFRALFVVMSVISFVSFVYALQTLNFRKDVGYNEKT